MTDREKIVDKIKKLLAKAKGTTNEAEAAVFAQKAHELLVKHDVDEAEIVTEDETVDAPIVGTDVKVRYHSSAISGLASAVAQYYMCGGIVVRRFRGSSIVRYDFIGRESRTIVASQMFKYIEDTIYRMSKERFPDGGNAKREFEKGASVNMAWRIVNMMKKARTDNPGNLPAIYDQAKAEFEQYTKGMDKLRRVPMKTGYGYREGAQAANNISMNAQVNTAQSSGTKNILLTSR